jgi:hypothetical protein
MLDTGRHFQLLPGEGKMRLRFVVCSLAAVTVGGLFGAPEASARDSSPSVVMVAVWKARIHATSADPAIRGTAEYVLKAVVPLERDFGVSLSHARRYSGRRLAVYLGGRFVGWMRVGGLGRAHLKLSTSDNQAVPKLRNGHHLVAIKTRRGVRVARGRLREIS